MKITLLSIGKTEENYLQQGIEMYIKRIHHYLTFEHLIIPALKNTKNLSQAEQKEKEAILIFQKIKPTEKYILLDEQGTQFTSFSFSQSLQGYMNAGLKNILFIVGGPYGFSEEVYAKALGKVSLSKLTLSHQMVRLLFVEQVYRALTILKGEPYHHQG